YSDRDPGFHRGSREHTTLSAACHVSSVATLPRGMLGMPLESVKQWRMVTSSLPWPLNSGTYWETGASYSIRPACLAIAMTVEEISFDTEYRRFTTDLSNGMNRCSCPQ